MKIDHLDNIKDLAPQLASNFVEDIEEVSAQTYREYQYYYKDIIGIGNKYFFGHLHDSEIISLKIINGNLSLILNDFSTLVFACALIDKMKLRINKRNLKFPFEIKTEETKHISLNIVENTGKIRQSKFKKLKEYLYEEIIEWSEENIEMAFDLWSSKLYPECRYLLLVSCKKMDFKENQNEYWEKYFGEKYNANYEYFTNERNKGVYLSDYSLCEKLMDKIIK